MTDVAAIKKSYLEVERVVTEKGLQFSGLVNNAGVVVAGPLEYIPVDELRKQFEINVFGQVTVTQVFLPLLKKYKGRIVMVSSVSGKMSFPLLSPYCSSKFALEALSDALRLELKPFGIEVCIVEPGMTNTPIWEKSLSAAAEMMDRTSKDPKDLAVYQPSIDKVIKNAREFGTRGTPPFKIAQKIEHALFSNFPKTRYVVGSGARAQVLLALFPDRMRDWILAKAIVGK